jgi:Glucodextranase, domain B
VITINDTIVVVEASGRFSTSVPLREGPNELDVISSDPAGDQASPMLVITYEPPA